MISLPILDFSKPTVLDYEFLSQKQYFKTYDVMPRKSDIPEEFFEDRNKWNNYFAMLFFCGGKKADAKEGIDKTKAWTHLMFILASWDTEHNQKIATCAYLGSLWLADVAETNNKPKGK